MLAGEGGWDFSGRLDTLNQGDQGTVVKSAFFIARKTTSTHIQLQSGHSVPCSPSHCVCPNFQNHVD